MYDYDPNDFLPQLPHIVEPIADARRLLADGATLEEVWRHLRDVGLDKIDSKWVTMIVTGMNSRDAKRALHHSETWADVRAATEQLHEDIIEAALEMGAEVRIGGELVEPPARR